MGCIAGGHAARKSYPPYAPRVLRLAGGHVGVSRGCRSFIGGIDGKSKNDRT